MRGRLLAEYIGTFALVFCGTGAIIINQETGGTVSHAGVAMTFGLIVLAMIYAFGEISGAHINPAVTIGFIVAKHFRVKDALPYIGAQLAGAITASAVLRYLFPANKLLGVTLPAGSEIQSAILETILTFILMLVILRVARGSRETGLMAGIAIGAVVGLEAMFAGPISGASMNPARSIGPALISGHYTSLWIYIVAPIFGSVAAAVVWKIFDSAITTGSRPRTE
jgi:aquaporin NIP